jgi:hypothetical protein
MRRKEKGAEHDCEDCDCRPLCDDQKAVEFWTKQVGFTVHREKSMGPQACWIEVGPPDGLVIYPKSMMEDWAERKPSIVFECENMEQTFAAMRDRRIKFTQEPRAMPWGVVRDVRQ